MIRLTRLNGKEFLLNSELIKFMEETPDTVITLVNGERFLVTESADEVVDRVVEFGKRLRIFATD
ncbi:MAG: flagellar FlbD family protein [Planctomycetes bacterium]|nr:flagellar FlbD family protein [Planctomycetota bacterium]